VAMLYRDKIYRKGDHIYTDQIECGAAKNIKQFGTRSTIIGDRS